MTNPEAVPVPADQFLEPGAEKASGKSFPTAVRWLPRADPPEQPAGVEDCDASTLEKWKQSSYAMAPYQFKRELGVVEKGKRGETVKERPLLAKEKEGMHGFRRGHTEHLPEPKRMSVHGNTFSCIAVAHLLAS